MMAYYQHFYAFDPFYAHWKGGGDIGAFQLSKQPLEGVYLSIHGLQGGSPIGGPGHEDLP